jgi:hypothetical protein
MENAMDKQKLLAWIEKLDPSQKDKVLVEVITYLTDSEDVRISDETGVPYWVSCGEDLGVEE